MEEELANEMSVVIENGLAVTDVARALHNYPSHGYLMHRVALAMALGNIWGSLEACGPVGGLLAHPGRFVTKAARLWRRRRTREEKDWEALGAEKGILVASKQKQGQGYQVPYRIISFLDAHEMEKDLLFDENLSTVMNRDEYIQWSNRTL